MPVFGNMALLIFLTSSSIAATVECHLPWGYLQFSEYTGLVLIPGRLHLQVPLPGMPFSVPAKSCKANSSSAFNTQLKSHCLLKAFPNALSVFIGSWRMHCIAIAMGLHFLPTVTLYSHLCPVDTASWRTQCLRGRLQ